ncbi:MAG: hypothetical protein AB7F35_00705 [Acetobacteraceae bacterium]
MTTIFDIAIEAGIARHHHVAGFRRFQQDIRTVEGREKVAGALGPHHMATLQALTMPPSPVQSRTRIVNNLNIVRERVRNALEALTQRRPEEP